MPVAVVAVPAMFAIIALIAGALLIELVARTIGQSIPLPGLDQIGRWVARAAGTVLNAMAGFLSGIAHGIEGLINVPVNALRGIFQSIANALARFAASIRYIFEVAIPNIFVQMSTLFFRAVDYARGLVIQFYNYAMQVIANVEGYLLARIQAAEDWLTGVIANVFNYVMAQIQSALQYALNFATDIYHTLTGFVVQVENYLLGEISSAIATVERYAQDLANWAVNTAYNAAVAWAAQYVNYAIGVAERDLDAIIAGEMGGIWNNIITMVHDAIEAVPAGVQWLEDRLNWVESLNPAGVLSAILALAGAISIPIEWVARCGTKLCSSLGGFGNEMDNLADDALIAIIVAFAAAAATDPRGVADETSKFVGESLHVVAQGFKDLVDSL